MNLIRNFYAPMKTRSIILYISLGISTTSLGSAFLLAGYWMIIPAFFMIGIISMALKKISLYWYASSFLLAFISLAAIGITLDLPTSLMILASSTALVNWDLMQFAPSPETNSSLTKHHLRSLTFAVLVGILMASLGANINLKIPFGLIIFLILITLSGLTYLNRLIIKNL